MARPRTYTDVKKCKACGEIKALDAFYVNERKNGNQSVSPRCKPCHIAQGREWRLAKHGSQTGYGRWRRYGMTQDDYDAMLASQGGLCAICKERPPDHVDHCHEGGQVRGLLCRVCNNALPLIEKHLAAALGYLGTPSPESDEPPTQGLTLG